MGMFDVFMGGFMRGYNAVPGGPKQLPPGGSQPNNVPSYSGHSDEPPDDVQALAMLKVAITSDLKKVGNNLQLLKENSQDYRTIEACINSEKELKRVWRAIREL